jgi:hypothetical protein
MLSNCYKRRQLRNNEIQVVQETAEPEGDEQTRKGERLSTELVSM